MPRTPKLHRLTRPGRVPYFQARIGGKLRHYGTDPAEAHRRFAEDLRAILGELPAKPTSIAGLTKAWENQFGGSWHKRALRGWYFFTARQSILDAEPDLLTRYVAWLRKQKWTRPHGCGSYSDKTIHDYAVAARRVLLWAAEMGWMPTPPRLPRMPRSVRQPRDVPIETVQNVLAKLKPKARRIIEWIAETGCRPSEACRLRWEHVDLDRGVAVLHVHKSSATGRPRIIPLTARAIELLEKPGDGFVFTSMRGKPYTPAGLRSIVRQHGLTGAYCLRHTRAQSLLDSGVSIGDVAAWLGHSNLATVQVYAQVRADRLRAVARSQAPLVSAQTRRPPQPDATEPCPDSGKPPRRPSKSASTDQPSPPAADRTSRTKARRRD